MNKPVLATILASVMLSLGKKKGGRSIFPMDEFLGTKDGKIIIDFRTRCPFRVEGDWMDSPGFRVIRKPIGNEIVEMLRRRESVYTSFGDGGSYEYFPPEYIDSIEILKEYPINWPFGRNLTHWDLLHDTKEAIVDNITDEQREEYAKKHGIDPDCLELEDLDEIVDELGLEPGYQDFLRAWDSLKHDIGPYYLEVRFKINANNETLNMSTEVFHNVCKELLSEYLKETLGETKFHERFRLRESDIIKSIPGTLPVTSGNVTQIRQF